MVRKMNHGFENFLTMNAAVLWNSLYMQEALSHLLSTGETPEGEHIARLSPLMDGHINMLGHYTFTLPENILKGELRPLNLKLNMSYLLRVVFNTPPNV